MTKWIYYGKGLPNTEINDISIAVAAKKIRVGTWGRGIWETNLYAEVVTNLYNTESTTLNNVFPNPFSDNLNIELNENEVTEKMYTLNGAQVAFKIKTNGTITQITPENNLPSGIYLLDIKTNTGIKVVKISKQ